MDLFKYETDIEVLAMSDKEAWTQVTVSLWCGGERLDQRASDYADRSPTEIRDTEAALKETLSSTLGRLLRRLLITEELI